MRRSEQEITQKDQLYSIIHSSAVCRLAMAKDGIPYVVPLSFGITFNADTLTLYFHCAKEGKKLEYLRSNPIVCFEMDSFDKITAGDNACSYGMSYQSIIGMGRVEFIGDEEEKINALQHIMLHNTGKTGFEFSKESVKRTVVFKVVSDDFAGKQA